MSKRKLQLINHREMKERFETPPPRWLPDAYASQLIMLKAHDMYSQTWEHYRDITLHVTGPFEQAMWGIQGALRTVQRVAMLDQLPSTNEKGEYIFDKKILRAGLQQDFSDLSTFWGKMQTIAASRQLANGPVQDTLFTIITRLQDMVQDTMQAVSDMQAGDTNASRRILEYVTDDALKAFGHEHREIRETLRNLSRPTSTINPKIWGYIESHPGYRIDAIRDYQAELSTIPIRDRDLLTTEILATLNELIDLYTQDNNKFHSRIDKIKSTSG